MKSCLCQQKTNPSKLENIIPPEIKNDEFYDLLIELARTQKISTVLEIGSSAGGGSTEALVSGLSCNIYNPELFCMEVSQTRFAKLKQSYAAKKFVKCYNTSSVSLAKFASLSEVEAFYGSTRTNLNFYPLQQVLGWLNQDMEYVIDSGLNEDGIKRIQSENGIDCFDMVLIDGSEFTGKAELNDVYGAKWLLLDDVNAFKNYENYQRLKNDPNYELYRENWNLRNGYAVFRKLEPELQIHFFTIVLNGMPFIRYHIDVFRHLPFRWHWHVVEGVAELVNDTAWSKPLGGHITKSIHRNGQSIDGTTEYLDSLKRLFPENITIYRKTNGEFWQGKTEMTNAPLSNIREECILWQIDVDEFWTFDQLNVARNLFISNPDKSAAFYWCDFFVGKELIVSSRNCYSQNPAGEWLRTWRYKPGDKWAAHEPPKLFRQLDRDHDAVNVATIAPFTHQETEQSGLVFQHFAYLFADQLRFKESYYGYAGALYQWLNLQKQTDFPQYLRDHFSWVQDGTTVDKTSAMGVVAIPVPYPQGSISSSVSSKFLIVIDGVFLQIAHSGIARVWLSLLNEWRGTAFAEHLCILDRNGTVPRIEGFKYEMCPLHNYDDLDSDRILLQSICDRLGADLFVSTYYSTPLKTPSLLMVHDMIPEIFMGEKRFSNKMWVEKSHAVKYAREYVAVSHNTAKDLVALEPAVSGKSVHVVSNGVTADFSRTPMDEVQQFKQKYNIIRPYYLFVGSRLNYKNFAGFMEAFSMLPDRDDYIVVTTHTAPLEPQFHDYKRKGWLVQTEWLESAELNAAYSGALALVYASLYEGFGLPILEAMRCGCPVIANNSGAMKEVAGEAACMFDASAPENLLRALMAMQFENVRRKYILMGYERANLFSSARAASGIMRVMLRMVGCSEGYDNILLEAK